MKFDIELSKNFEENIIINYGIIKGNNKILFIKAGQDGSMYGYENKYLRIAKRINEKYGYTVIASSNPFDGRNPLDNAMEVIEEYCKDKFDDYDIYYMGHSNGGLIGAWFGNNYEKIRKMLLINAPLMYNWHKTKDGIKKFNGELVSLIYGEFDQSIKYTELLLPLTNEKIKLNIIKNEDHHFKNDMEDFLSLPEKYLIEME